MRQKIFRISEELDVVLNDVADKTGMTLQEIISRGIVSIAVGNGLPVEGTVVSERDFRKPWSTEDVNRLKELRRDRVSAKEIGRILGRTHTAISSQIRKREI